MSKGRGTSNWEDPYVHVEAELCDSERDPGDDDVMYAECEVHPGVSSHYPAARPDMHSPRNSTAARPGGGVDPLSSRRSSVGSASNRPGAYSETASTGRSMRYHPLDPHSNRAQSPFQSGVGGGVTYGTAPPQVAHTGARVGVGVMLDSSGSESFQESYDSSAQHQRNRTQRRASSLTTTTELNLPPPKELPPKSPYHQAIEPPMPLPKRSRRYLKDAVRMPDICVGTYPTGHRTQQQHHKLQVKCDSCQNVFLVPKSCVLLKCPQCKHVSSAMPAFDNNGPSFTRIDEFEFAP